MDARGYRVLSVWNHDVFHNISRIMERILNLIETVPHLSTLIPSPFPQGVEGSSSATSFNTCAQINIFFEGPLAVRVGGLGVFITS